MLSHEEQPEEKAGEGSAAQVRVTAEEFARAVTRYQNRREQAAQRMEGTVAIGDAVQELGLEATSEEILAEVQAERAAPQVRSAARGGRLVSAGIGVALLAVMCGGLWMTTRSVSPLPKPAIIAPAPSPLVTVSVPGGLLVQDTGSGKPILRTLAEIPDSHPVRCALDMTGSRAAFADFSNSPMTWTLVKHGGRVYVRGWIAAMSPQAVRGSVVNIYNNKALVPTGAPPTPMTLPLDAFQCNPGLGADDMLSAEHVRPDEHFGEKW